MTPWGLAKDESKKGRLAMVLYNLAETLRIISIIIEPFMPETPEKIRCQLGIPIDYEMNWDSAKKWGGYKTGLKVFKSEAMFPRIDLKKEMEEIEKILDEKNKNATDGEKENTKTCEKTQSSEKSQSSEKTQTPPKAVTENTFVNINGEDKYITIDDFAKIDLRVAKVLECTKVEGADKLLKLKLDVGGEERQVVSGIAKHYQPESMVGKNVIIVANLKPIKLRGIESKGMILCAEENDKLILATVESDIGSGSIVK